MARSHRRLQKAAALGGSALAAAAPLATAGDAHATSYLVLNTNDSGAGSLRALIESANSNLGPDVITFDAGVTGTITLLSGISITDDLTITGPGAATLALSGGDANGILYISDGADVSIASITLTDGNSPGNGGAVRADDSGNVSFDDVVIENNVSNDEGGGIFFDSNRGQLSITDSTISGNTADGMGGGVYVNDTLYLGAQGVYVSNTVITGNTTAEFGGGIMLYQPDGDVTFLDSTISDNDAGDAGGGVMVMDTDGSIATDQMRFERVTISGNTTNDNGGGIALYDPDTPVAMINTTISGNTADGDGGGVFMVDLWVDFTIAHSTIADNTATTGTGGGIHGDADTLEVTHSIIADNTATSNHDVDSTINSTTWSLIENGGASTLNEDINTITGEDPELGTLGDHGGSTETQVPASTSPAVDGGNPAVSGAPTTDQRGLARIVGAAIDLGAVEAAPPVTDDTATTTADTLLTVAAPGVLANDAGGDHVTVLVTTTHGVLVLAADGSYTYRPNAGFTGVDTFTYTAFDASDGELGVGTVTITVTAGPRLPETGSSSSTLAVFAAAAMAVGATLRRLSRRAHSA